MIVTKSVYRTSEEFKNGFFLVGNKLYVDIEGEAFGPLVHASHLGGSALYWAKETLEGNSNKPDLTNISPISEEKLILSEEVPHEMGATPIGQDADDLER